MKPVLAKRHAARLNTTGLSRVLPQIQSLLDASRQHIVSTANVAPSFRLIEKLHLQIQNLRRMRDLLLPRLLSGQVEVVG